jgi:hypothetical protein
MAEIQQGAGGKSRKLRLGSAEGGIGENMEGRCELLLTRQDSVVLLYEAVDQ